MHNLKSFRFRAALSLAALSVLSGLSAAGADAPGAVYTMTNAAGGNSIVMYDRAANGTLSGPELVATGGLGTGQGLGSQGAIALSDNGHWLLVANAGSNDVTVFQVNHDGLTITDKQPSGGAMPVSIALQRDAVFVLNAGGAANISGFRLTAQGKLVPVAGSMRVLPGQAPAQVSFASHGEVLVVTEKNSNTITMYSFDDGRLGQAISHSSQGLTPFGFAVTQGDVLVVSEAGGGAPGASTVSSYEADDDGRLRVVTSALPTGQKAACWVAVTGNGKYAYIANTGSATVSSMAVSRSGALTLLDAAAGHTPAGTSPIDLAFSDNNKYLYSLATNTITVFRVSSDGSLSPVQVVSGIPGTDAGLAAR